jgi:RHS repeat-associated protein
VELLAEYATNASPASPQKENGYRNGQLLITAMPQVAAPNTIGLYDPASANFYLKNANSAGNADVTFGFGPGGLGWLPLTGDWDGDGRDTIGLYDPASANFYLKNANSAGNADVTFGFGPGGLGWVPLTGDWDGDGVDTIGLYDPASGTFYLKNANSAGTANLTFVFGPGGMGRKPLAADWDGDGIDTIGLYDPATGNFSLKNANAAGNADLTFVFGGGGSGWTAITGDWNSDGLDTIGLYAPATGNFYLKNANTVGNADLVVGYGPAGLGWKPVTGNWGVAGGGSTTNIQWLVSDQLGTPRLIFNKTGARTATKRHDYLPFGEELFAGTGGRTSGQGYNAADGVRQKFTSKERDNETGLDYFGARYYASIQGRFTGVDPAPITLRQLLNPQDLNRFAYVASNPLKFIDPTGEEKILIVVTTFIPQPSVTAPVSGRRFEGDDRNVGDPGGFRTQQTIIIETDPSKGKAEISKSRDTGITHELGPDGSYIGQGQASGESLEAAVTRGESGVFVQMKGNESDPLIALAPGITYDFQITVQSEGSQGNLTVSVGGSHDSFPGYEVTVTRIEQPKPTTTVAYGYDPRPAGTTAKSLIPGNSTTLNPPVRTVIAGQSPAPPPAPAKKHGKKGDD